ncbi:MAG: GNAT family N-acetyltransferase [Planctomycetia bacterium]|jgi:ribosomal protein S18 acetylase RimI-like enzyme
MLTYFKRFRMEIPLEDEDALAASLPDGYHFAPWDSQRLEDHAWTKYHSFCDEIDANLFTCFGSLSGCRRLMRDITSRQSFIPGATWLVLYQPDETLDPEPCGTIQGIDGGLGFGSIQNVGVTPPHRGFGIGEAMVRQAMRGFYEYGLHRATLEVTVDNRGAVRLYKRIGFEPVKTVYKPAEIVCV